MTRPLVAIVTGAAGGIGSAIAQRLADGKYALVLTDKDHKALDKLAFSLGRSNVEITSVVADACDPDAPRLLVSRAVELFGQVDVLIGAAGATGLASFTDLEFDEWNSILDVNLSSAFRISQAVARQMIAQKNGGAIVHIASIAYRNGGAHPAYGAAKGGLVTLCYGMAQRLGPEGITVNAVAPGIIDTPMVRNNFRGDAFRRLEEGAVAHTPMRRLGKPSDVAELVAFLVSDRARFITGAVIPVTGGIELLPPIASFANGASA